MQSMSKGREIINTTEHIQDIFKKHIKEFVDPGIIDVQDSNLDHPSKYEKAKVRVLIAFLMRGLSKCKSVTDGVLISLIKQKLGDDVYVDVAFTPEKQNFSLYEEYKLPAWHGVCSHRSVNDFDVVFISNSVISEKANLPWLYHHSGIPIWHTQRMKGDWPFFFVGGNSSDFVDVFLGGNGVEQGLIDGAFVGYGEGVIPGVIDTMLEPFANKEERLRKFFRFDSFVHPLAYQFDLKDKWRIAKINKVIDEAPDKVQYHKEESFDSCPSDVRKILYPSADPAENGMDLIVSWGCSSGGSCSFCHEGNIAGGWREKSIERIRQDLISSRKFTMCDSINWLSFNNNYYSKYFDLVKVGAEVYPRVVFMTMRADIIAARPDYFDLAKKLGLNSISFGFEGISERIRFYLNKNVSTDDFRKAIYKCIESHFQSVKLYCIYTGKETEDDVKEFLAFITEMRDYARKMDANIHFEVSFTHLTYCTNCPLAWEKRNTYINFLNGVRSFDALIKGCMGMGMVVRFSSRAWTNLVMQLMIDMGRVFTPYMVDMSINHDLLIHKRDFDHDLVNILFEKLKADGIDIYDVFDEKPYDCIFPDDFINWNKEYLVRVSKKVREFKQVDYCLSTPAKSKGKCVSCGYCDTKEKKKARLERSFEVQTHIDDILSTHELNRANYKLLVKIWRKPEFSHLNVMSNFRYMWARIMRELPDEFILRTHQIGRCSYSIGAKGNIPDYSWGLYLGEVYLKREYSSIDELFASYERVKDDISTLELQSIRYVDVDYKAIRYDDWQIVVIFPVKGVVSLMPDKIMNFDRKIIYPKNVLFSDYHNLVDNVSMPEIPDILFHGASGAVVVALPNKLNPYVFISSVTGIRFLDVYSKFSCQRIKYYRQGLSVCSTSGCGNHVMFDIYEQKESKFCELCTRKAIIKKLG